MRLGFTGERGYYVHEFSQIVTDWHEARWGEGKMEVALRRAPVHRSHRGVLCPRIFTNWHELSRKGKTTTQEDRKMKSHLLVNTRNTQRGLECVNYLMNRPVANQLGLGMIYGKPGLGKTQFSMRYVIEHNYVYLSALKASSPKSFIVDLYRSLRERYAPEENEPIVGHKARIFREILDLINLNTTREHQPVIFIDEVDNILHYPHEEIIGMLRDIADNTVASVILVGMQNLRDKIQKLNSHYYNRFIYFAEFKPLTDNDAVLLCRELAEIEISAELARFANRKDQANGDARKIIKSIRLFEEIAGKMGVQKLSLADFQKVVLK